jgi:hypothetical protein
MAYQASWIRSDFWIRSNGWTTDASSHWQCRAVRSRALARPVSPTVSLHDTGLCVTGPGCVGRRNVTADSEDPCVGTHTRYVAGGYTAKLYTAATKRETRHVWLAQQLLVSFCGVTYRVQSP